MPEVSRRARGAPGESPEDHFFITGPRNARGEPASPRESRRVSGRSLFYYEAEEGMPKAILASLWKIISSLRVSRENAREKPGEPPEIISLLRASIQNARREPGEPPEIISLPRASIQSARREPGEPPRAANSTAVLRSRIGTL